VLSDVFFASIFLAYVEPNFFSRFRAGKLPVQPLSQVDHNGLDSLNSGVAS